MQARRKVRKFSGPVAIEEHLRKKVLLQSGPKVVVARVTPGTPSSVDSVMENHENYIGENSNSLPGDVSFESSSSGCEEKSQILGHIKNIENILILPPTPSPEVCELSPRNSQHEETMEVEVLAPVVPTLLVPCILVLAHEWPERGEAT
jgi:hypothetical protein